MTRKKVLISGASIAGPTLAFWLARFGFGVTIVERADSLRLGGQNIDISGAAQKIAQWMGIEDEIKAANTGEVGVRFVNGNNITQAELPKGESDLGTRELEILRGDLVEILYRHTKDDVEYLFGNQVTAVQEEKEGVAVTFQNGDIRRFDILVCADGIRSKTRALLFGNEPVIRFLNLYVSYFTIPKAPTDTNWARWYNATGARVITMRPDNVGTTRASFSFMSKPKGYERLPAAEQKKVLKDKFANAGWETPRLLAALDENPDIYFDGISQVMAPRWWKGHCAMTGDAAYCPSPISGKGASLAMIGAYILAGELARQPNHEQAFTAYETLLRPYVKQVQKLPPGAPRLAHPKTKVGIALFNAVIRIISSRLVKKLSSLFSAKGKSPTDDTIVLPDYG